MQEYDQFLLYHISKRQITDGFIAVLTAILRSTIFVQINYGICNFAKRQNCFHFIIVIVLATCHFHLTRLFAIDKNTFSASREEADLLQKPYSSRQVLAPVKSV